VPPDAAENSPATCSANTNAETGSTDWVTVTARHRLVQSNIVPSIRCKGSRSDATVKSVPRKNILSAFVGRLHLDTSEEELTKFLTNEGIKGVVCRKLVAKMGKVQHSGIPGRMFS